MLTSTAADFPIKKRRGGTSGQSRVNQQVPLPINVKVFLQGRIRQALPKIHR
jgi:hypothetical protein